MVMHALEKYEAEQRGRDSSGGGWGALAEQVALSTWTEDADEPAFRITRP